MEQEKSKILGAGGPLIPLLSHHVEMRCLVLAGDGRTTHMGRLLDSDVSPCNYLCLYVRYLPLHFFLCEFGIEVKIPTSQGSYADQKGQLCLNELCKQGSSIYVLIANIFGIHFMTFGYLTPLCTGFIMCKEV